MEKSGVLKYCGHIDWWLIEMNWLAERNFKNEINLYKIEKGKIIDWWTQRSKVAHR